MMHYCRSVSSSSRLPLCSYLPSYNQKALSNKKALSALSYPLHSSLFHTAVYPKNSSPEPKISHKIRWVPCRSYTKQIPNFIIPYQSFTDKVWEEAQPTFQNILKHAFIQELAKGTLPLNKFLFYMRQDIYYLKDMSKVADILVKRATQEKTGQVILEYIATAIQREIHFYEAYLDKCQIVLNHKQSDACHAYIHYLTYLTKHASYAESVAGILPCFWIYQEVGRHLYLQAAPQNPYQPWIDKYGGKAFSRSVQQLIQLVDVLAEKADKKESLGMRIAFMKSFQFDWLFWESCYQNKF